MDIQAFEEKVLLCLQKLDRDIDLDWSEIVDKLGLTCSPDHLRKLSYAYKEYAEYVKLKGSDDMSEDMKAELDKQILEIKKQKMLLSDLRVEINKQTRSQARFEQLLDTVRYCVDRVDSIKPYTPYKPPLPIDGEVIREGVLLISDIHYGQKTENHWNTYNSEEFERRMSVLYERVVNISKLHKVQKINIMGLGDYINGLIHTTTRLSNRESIADQVINISEAISTLAYNLAQEVPYVTLSMTDDNHSRMFANKNENTDKDSFVPFMKHFIKARISGLPNVVFIENEVDSGISVLNVSNHTIVGVHGDKDKLATAIPRMTSLLGTHIDYMCVAHYHNIKEDTYGNSELIVNGSFGGTDDYAKNLRLHSKPQQKYMIFSRPYGRECTYNIDLRGEK